MSYTARQMRDYQAKRRGSVPWRSLLEDAAVMVAWAGGEVSTGRAARAMGVDVVELRARYRAMLAVAAGRLNVEVADERFEAVVAFAGMNPDAAERGEWRQG